MVALFFLLLFTCFIRLNSRHVTSYSEDHIFDYIRRAAENPKISPKCAKSLERVLPLLSSNFTITQQREFFRESFGSGEAHQFLSRDLDRWFYKSMECQKVAGETGYSVSEYPVCL
jgi:hypothetical protein